jgi:hypothetical protein
MDYKLELVKILKHCIENRNYLMNSEGDIDKGARSVYQEIRVMIDKVLESEGKQRLETTSEHSISHGVKGCNSSAHKKCIEKYKGKGGHHLLNKY